MGEETLLTLTVQPTLDLADWTEEFRYLSPEASAEPGKYRIERAEYQRGMMQAINDPSIKEVVMMTSAQVGKTEVLLNTIGYHIHYEPAPILVVQPTLSMAQSFSKERLSNMIRDCPCLKGSVKDPRTRDSGNTTLHKSFSQGHITICGANSASSLASRPIRIVLLDEVDRYPPSAGSEGDPVRLATKRTQTFWNAKKVMVSTPTIKGASRIEAAFLESDQRYYYVPCPICNAYQTLKWKQVTFDSADPAAAKYKCEECDGLWNDAERWRAVRLGEWREHAESKGIAGFHINEIYSSWSTLEKMVGNFLEAKKLPETLKTFINTSLAETWEEQGEGVDDISFMQRRENYSSNYLPNGIVVLVAGVDVQDNRLEVEVLGFGLDEENWSVEYEILYGDPSTMDLWIRLDEFLKKKHKRQDGVELSITSAAIDSGGHYTQAVYNFCRGKLRRRIHAIKGVAGFGKPIWPKRASIRNIGKVPLYTVGVDVAKDIIYKRLKIEDPGPGYCHFPMYEHEYFEQLASEKIVFTYHKGFPARKFISTRARNEALDCRVYAYAAFVGLQPDLKKVEEKQKSLRVNQVEEKVAISVKALPSKVVQTCRRSQSSQRQTSNFAHSWKNF
jgi:phage terminase large subunit GpA-like protein